MKRLTYAAILTLAIFGLIISTGFAAGPSAMVGEYGISADPCANHNSVKSTVAISSTSSSTDSLVAAVTGKKVYVCDVVVTAVGTNPTVTFKYGTTTSTACDTGATSLTGAMNPSATVGVIHAGYGGTLFATAASKQLCITTAATTTAAGFVTYVQQ